VVQLVLKFDGTIIY